MGVLIIKSLHIYLKRTMITILADVLQVSYPTYDSDDTQKSSPPPCYSISQGFLPYLVTQLTWQVHLVSPFGSFQKSGAPTMDLKQRILHIRNSKLDPPMYANSYRPCTQTNNPRSTLPPPRRERGPVVESPGAPGSNGASKRQTAAWGCIYLWQPGVWCEPCSKLLEGGQDRHHLGSFLATMPFECRWVRLYIRRFDYCS